VGLTRRGPSREGLTRRSPSPEGPTRRGQSGEAPPRSPHRAAVVKRHRNFDPRRIGALESAAWVAYYRRDWPALLRASLGLTRQMFGLPWWLTIRGAWLIMRANQHWAPHPENHPDRARATMARFYAMLAAYHSEDLDPVRAAALEVEWRIHRAHQYGSLADDTPLVDALAALYAYVYGVPEPAVRLAAEQRALAMTHSDEWVAAGCRVGDALLIDERAALVRSYAALLAAVHR
jgi:hypothetical protein